MSTINKQLYDALISASVSDDLATKAAESVIIAPAHLTELQVRLTAIETRLSLVEKLQWIIVAGILGLLVKAFLGA